MSARFFLAEMPAADEAELSGAEAHHLRHVVRGQVGDEVVLFDGRGTELTTRIVSLGRSQVRLAVLARQTRADEAAVSITLGVALPKGDRQKWLVEKATELGVTELVALRTRRGVAQPEPQVLHRLRRTAIEAAKQCGRLCLPRIVEQSLPDFLTAAPADAARWFAHRGDASRPLADVLPPAMLRNVWIAVGPEGGFTEEEAKQAGAAGWQSVSLGANVLRIETAAVALLSFVTLHSESRRPNA